MKKIVQLNLEGKPVLINIEELLPKKCLSCRHCGFIPDSTKQTFYCWSIEGLCENVIEYCNENNHYDVAPERLEKYFGLNTWFFNGKILGEKLGEVLKIWEDNDSFDDIAFINAIKDIKKMLEAEGNIEKIEKRNDNK